MEKELFSFIGALAIVVAVGFVFRSRRKEYLQSYRVYRHLKTGGEYAVLAEGLQEATGRPCVIYTAVATVLTPRPWVRDYNEFYDGRFEFVKVITFVNGKLEK